MSGLFVCTTGIQISLKGISLIQMRLAAESDIEEIARLFLRSRQVALPFLPIIHSPEEDRAHMQDMHARGRITLAEEEDNKLLGFLVDLDGWVAHLYLDPDVRRQGIGQMLLDDAKTRHDTLELWCFQQNWAARAFYEQNGFVAIKETDGDNEEKLPDRLYRWQKRAG